MTVARYIALSLISRYHCLDPTNRDISGLHCIWHNMVILWNSHTVKQSRWRFCLIQIKHYSTRGPFHFGCAFPMCTGVVMFVVYVVCSSWSVYGYSFIVHVFLNVLLVQETIKAFEFEFGVESVKQSLNSIETNQGLFHSDTVSMHTATMQINSQCVKDYSLAGPYQFFSIILHRHRGTTCRSLPIFGGQGPRTGA